MSHVLALMLATVLAQTPVVTATPWRHPIPDPVCVPYPSQREPWCTCKCSQDGGLLYVSNYPFDNWPKVAACYCKDGVMYYGNVTD